MAVIDIGIDLGSTGLRAAYSSYGGTPTVRAITGQDWPWLLAEPAASGPVPVSFPSLKSKLGSGERAGSADPADVISKALDAVRAEVLREPGASIGHTVISVPARFYTAQRTALLAAATDAGLSEVSLITDSVAAVIERTEDRSTGTYLVYGMGYDGYELGLIRAVHGTYRVLGYEGAGTPCGAALDARVLGDWLAALNRYGMTSSEVRRRGVGWLELRRLAEQVTLRLAGGESVLFPWAVPDLGGNLHVQFDQASFNQLCRAAFTATLDRAAALLDRARLATSALDEVILVGGCTALPVLREVVDGFGRPVAATGADHLARGALRHAQQFGRRPTSSYDEPLLSPEPDRTDRLPGAAPVTTTVLTAPGDPPTKESTLDSIRQLIDAGRRDAARSELRTVIATAKRMLAELDAGQERGDEHSAAELITAARKRFEEGQHHDAIGLAHLAWYKDRDDVDLFEEMIDLHCTAAMASPTIASFDADERWLKCALQHDLTSTRIRTLLAERTFLQARDLLKAGNRDRARRALGATLDWAPDHPEATALLRELNR